MKKRINLNTRRFQRKTVAVCYSVAKELNCDMEHAIIFLIKKALKPIVSREQIA